MSLDSMRARLSREITDAAKNDHKIIVLSGDHGYSLWDEMRNECPNQFLNCGMIEQAMIGIAAGLAKIGFKPIVYGLASFIPMRVLEQIKLDLCHPSLPVILLGDGAGLVYAKLGASHHCAEDIACLRALPNIEIRQPADENGISYAIKWGLISDKPVYIRIGRTDLGLVGPERFHKLHDVCIVGSGSMAKKANDLAEEFKTSSFIIENVHPIRYAAIHYINSFKTVIVMEEHSKYGGVYSTIVEKCQEPKIHSISLKSNFSTLCGDWKFALSEHDMDDESLRKRVKEIVNLS